MSELLTLLPPVFLKSLAANGGVPIPIEDPGWHQEITLAPAEHLPPIRLEPSYMKAGVQKTVEQFERGESLPWDIGRTMKKAEQGREDLL
ncbi:hypothetical protein [Adhaeretor mobilis]|nr:hypothetical protein [Adhaeretor mobilis]